MRLHQTEQYIKSNLTTEAKNFTIQVNQKAFKLLSDNIYTDKIRAIVRELTTNALDAHIDAGNPNPIEVHLPTTLDATFYVKDCGTGMSPETIEDLYSSYFGSSKSESNEQIGAMGIGSKSPFSYTDSLTVETIFDGTKYIYSCSISSQGFPQTQLVGSFETDEVNGVKVAFPVMLADHNEFARKAARVFWSFDSEPTITGNLDAYDSYKEEFKADILLKGEGWVIYDKNPLVRSAHVRMGQIIYPLNEDILRKPIAAKDLTHIMSAPIIFEMPLGSCDIAPSREELNYDEHTIHAIILAMIGLKESINEVVAKSINESPTYWSAIYTCQEIFKTVFGARVDISEFGLEYKGQKLSASIKLPENLNNTYVGGSKKGWGDGKYDWSVTHNLGALFIGKDRQKKIKVLVCEPKHLESTYAINRVKNLIKTTYNEAQFLMISRELQDEEKAVLDGAEIMYYSDLPKIVRNRTSGPRAVTVKVCKITPKKGLVSKEVDFKDIPKSAYLIARHGRSWGYLKDGQFHKEFVPSEQGTFLRSLRLMVETGFKRSLTVVILPLSKARLVNLPNYNNLQRIFTRRLTKIEKCAKSLSQVSSLKRKYSDIIQQLSHFAEHNFAENSRFGAFVVRAKEEGWLGGSNDDPSSKVRNSLDRLEHIAGGFSISPAGFYARCSNIKRTINGVNDLINDEYELFTTYPMMNAFFHENIYGWRGGMCSHSLNPTNGRWAMARGDRGFEEEKLALNYIIRYINMEDALASQEGK